MYRRLLRTSAAKSCVFRVPSRERSLLFLSCDLVGSTSYKQVENQWQAAFLAFYRQFPQKIGDVANELDVSLEFHLWKPIGDELIFTVHVEHEDDVYDAVVVWLQAMAEYETETLSKTSMGTKGGAFIATFPGPDSESSIPRDPSAEDSDKSPILLNDEALSGQRKYRSYLYDYFGPSIDTGFRILSRCTPRHFTLSVEVAWALLRSHRDQEIDRPLDHLDFLEQTSLKGVWRGRDYPVFALDRHHADGVNETLKALVGTKIDLNAAEKVCKACVSRDDWFSGIYLPKSGDPDLRRRPVDSLAEARKEEVTSMEGGESLPEDEDTDSGSDLPEQAPLGDE